MNNKNIFSIQACKRNSIFLEKTFYEYFDYKKLMCMKDRKFQDDNNMCDGNKCLVDKFIKNFEKYCNIKNKAFIKVEYLPPKRENYGRVKAIDAISLLYFRRDFRSFLAKDLYHDIDVENCHFNLLLNVLIKSNYNVEKNFPNLYNYCKYREEIMNQVINYYFPNTTNYKENRKKVKVLFLRLIYLGGEGNWKKDYNIDKDVNKFINGLMIELKEISEIIFKKNYELQLIAKIAIKEGGKNESKNINAKVMAYYLQNLERLLLEAIYEIIINLKDKNGQKIMKENSLVLCYDGLMILKEDLNKIDGDILIKIQNKLKNDFKVYFTLTKKLMDDDNDIFY